MKIVGIILTLLVSTSAFAAMSSKKVGDGNLVEKTFEVTADECIANLNRVDGWELNCKVVVKNSVAPNETLVRPSQEKSTYPATETGRVNLALSSDLDGYTVNLQSSYPINDAQARDLIRTYLATRSAITVLSFVMKQ